MFTKQTMHRTNLRPRKLPLNINQGVPMTHWGHHDFTWK